jgi:dTDP-4-dehydrorhamnose reductase
MTATCRILVAGDPRDGQLARALVEASRTDGRFTVIAAGRPRLDLLDGDILGRAIDETQPDLVVNAAAYTAVDKAESDSAAAFALNCDGAAALARVAGERGCPIIHISTDYVFDGTKPGPYVEQDPPNPIGVYARSKRDGELAVAAANPRHLILRTAWLYAPYGHNFLRTMLRLARERPQLRVVADQHGSPTYAPHLAEAILAIAARLHGGEHPAPWGTYHAAAAGETTWAGFAAAIVEAGARLGVPQVPIVPITTAEYPTAARRPANSRLDCSKLERIFGVRLPPWRQGIEDCIAALAREAERALCA